MTASAPLPGKLFAGSITMDTCLFESNRGLSPTGAAAGFGGVFFTLTQTLVNATRTTFIDNTVGPSKPKHSRPGLCGARS